MRITELNIYPLSYPYGDETIITYGIKWILQFLTCEIMVYSACTNISLYLGVCWYMDALLTDIIGMYAEMDQVTEGPTNINNIKKAFKEAFSSYITTWKYVRLSPISLAHFRVIGIVVDPPNTPIVRM